MSTISQEHFRQLQLWGLGAIDLLVQLDLVQDERTPRPSRVLNPAGAELCAEALATFRPTDEELRALAFSFRGIRSEDRHNFHAMLFLIREKGVDEFRENAFRQQQSKLARSDN